MSLHLDVNNIFQFMPENGTKKVKMSSFSKPRQKFPPKNISGDFEYVILDMFLHQKSVDGTFFPLRPLSNQPITR